MNHITTVAIRVIDGHTGSAVVFRTNDHSFIVDQSVFAVIEAISRAANLAFCHRLKVNFRTFIDQTI